MSARYRVSGSWRVRERSGSFVWECADVVDAAGNVWHDGAHRVSGPAGRIMRQRIGETAWSHAERAFRDALLARDRARSEWSGGNGGRLRSGWKS